jgi:hypothetical protein
MTHELEQLLIERISGGLKKKALKSCSRWSEANRIMTKTFPGPWNFDHHPWLREMHDSKAEMNVGQKAAQMGFTEWALNVTFFKIDVEGEDCLYILPSSDDASDFSASRFDPALEASPYLRDMFSDVRNVGHKRAGQFNLFVRGSRSRSKLKSIPTGFIVFDEVDEMMQENIPLAMERQSGQVRKQVLMISTPTLADIGINQHYNQTTQEEFFFKCPHCSKLIMLSYPDSLVITAEEKLDQKIKQSHLICTECKGVLPHGDKVDFLSTGRFVPQHSDRDWRGFTVSQLYSCTVSPVDLARAYFDGLRDPTAETEFFNSKLGLPHMVDGAKVSDTDLVNCTGGYRKGKHSESGKDVTRGRVITMGVDVGKWLHVEIDAWDLPEHPTPGLEVNDEAKPTMILEDTFKDFSDLNRLMIEYGVWFAVVDRHPETRMAYKFACDFWGRVLLCMYGKGVSGKQTQLGAEEERTITVDRTSWLDLSLGRFKTRSIKIPVDTSFDYKRHVKDLTRVYEMDAYGNPVGRYVTTTNNDHFAHARNYSEIALSQALTHGESHDIQRAP